MYSSDPTKRVEIRIGNQQEDDGSMRRCAIERGGFKNLLATTVYTPSRTL
jgi:hypothetical protein